MHILVSKSLNLEWSFVIHCSSSNGEGGNTDQESFPIFSNPFKFLERERELQVFFQ